VTKAIVHVGPPRNANRGQETMIAIEKVVAILGQRAGAKPATGTSANAMRDVVQIGHVMRIVHAARIGHAMRIGHVMQIGRAVQIGHGAQTGHVARLVHAAQSDRWAARSTATSANYSAGSTSTATTCSAGASSPSYRNSSPVVGPDHRAVPMVRVSVGAVLTVLRVGAAIDLKCECVSGASKVRRAAMAPVRAIATAGAHAAMNVAVQTVPIMHPTGPDRRKPARTRLRPFEPA
jgi:hypothetical protein